MRKSKSALPEVGDPSPTFSLPDGEGRTHRLEDYRGKWVVLYFYPRDNTPGCTREACDFRDAFPGLRRRKVAVLGVSTDPAEAHEEFRSQYKLPFPLLVDAGAVVSKRFGVWQEKINFGRKYLGIVRSTFVIDPQGRLSQAYRGVRVEGHVDEVSSWIESQA